MHQSPLKKWIILSFLFISSIHQTFSQQATVEPKVESNSKVSLTFQLNYLSPTGEFAELSDNDYESYNLSADYKDLNLAGKATGGVYTSLEASYQFHKCFEMGLHAGYSNTNTDPSNFRDLFDLDSLTEISISSTSGNWETISTLLTASGNIYYKKWKGTLSLMAGIQFAWSPEVTLNRNIPETGTFNGVDAYHITYSQPSRQQAAPCYGAAANVSYSLNKKFSIKLNGSYQTSKHDFDNGGTLDYKSSIMTPQGNVNTVIISRGFNFAKTISFYTIGIGVGYTF